MPEGIPPYVLVARITSVLGMSFSLAIGLLLLLAGDVPWALVAFVFFIPSFGLMAIVERHMSAPRQDDDARSASDG